MRYSSALAIRALTLSSVINAFAACAAFAQRATTDPIRDYLALQNADTIAEDEKSPYLMRLPLDINHNGRPVIFLSFDFLYQKGAGYIWTAYEPTARGYFRIELFASGESLTFFPQRVFLGRIPEVEGRPGLVTYMAASGLVEVHAYWLKHHMMFDQIIGQMDEQLLIGPKKAGSVLSEYFPTASEVEPKQLQPVEHISIDDLRMRGYHIPRRKTE
jgi:hypothetical protein